MMQASPSGSEFDFLVRLAAAAADAVLPHFRTAMDVENKAAGGRYDPVTVADRAAETAIRDIVRAAYPDDAILGEEFGPERLGAPRTWVIDPIDGTRSFVTGVPLWGTLVGRVDGDRPVLGLMSQPYIGETFLGDGARAELRRGGSRRPLATRPAASLAEARMMTTSPEMFAGADREAYDRIARAVQLSRFGGDCYAYCMVAAGLVDLVVEAGLQSYDIVPLIPIIEGAGGAVAAWDGGSPRDGGRIVAAASRELLDAAIALLGRD
jgi:histidinol phosphatase-like enzyme (inositol monophosphatase family)